MQESTSPEPDWQQQPCISQLHTTLNRRNSPRFFAWRLQALCTESRGLSVRHSQHISSADSWHRICCSERTMKVAVPQWQDRIAPVFDVTGHMLVIELDGGEEVGRWRETFDDLVPEQRARRLIELGVNVLICGAISQPLEALLTDRGIRVFARVCGDVDEILQAFRTGTFRVAMYAMPGCRRHRSRHRARHRRGNRCSAQQRNAETGSLRTEESDEN